MREYTTVLTDEDGDVLLVSPKEVSENWPPNITIVAGLNERAGGSVVFSEDDAPDVVAGIVRGLNLDVSKLYNIIGKIQDIIDQKESVSTFEHVTDGSPCPCGPMVENIN